MKTNKERIYDYIISNYNDEIDFTTNEIALGVNITRSNTSRHLNELVEEKKLCKNKTRPVTFRLRSDANEDSFSKLIGSEGSLRNQVQLAKAAILYPERTLATLIKGPIGSGKDFFAEAMTNFMKANNIVYEDANLIKINVNSYLDQKELEDDLYNFETGVISTVTDKKTVVLLIKNIDSLSVRVRERIFSSIESGLIIISTIDSDAPSSLKKTIESRYSATVTLPGLEERPIDERFEYVKKFLNIEARQMQKNLDLNAELLRCLLLYKPEQNIQQLKNDIKLGCANAYIRNVAGNQNLKIILSDFPLYIRKGFLYYKDRRNEVESIIPDNYSYTFSSESMELAKEEALLTDNSIYKVLDNKVDDLKKQGLDNAEIELVINETLDEEFLRLNKRVTHESFDRASLAKIVDYEIVESVEKFLADASTSLNRIFPKSVFYGLSLHLKAALSTDGRKVPNLNENIAETIERYPKEYNLSKDFVIDLNKKFGVDLPIQETVFICMFISKTHELDQENKPIVIVAMHGNNVAGSVVDVVKTLVGVDNIYAYDLKLGEAVSDAYDELKFLILEKHQNNGVLIIYDMGSIKTMADTIQEETGIHIMTLAIPLTLIALDASRKASTFSLDDLYNNISESYQDNVSSLREEYNTPKQKKTIVTLCMTGEGSSLQMKNYLYENLNIDNINIVSLAISDKPRLINEINALNKNSEVISIVGTYNPHLFNIPFVPISKIFETPVDKLDLLLTLNETTRTADVDYEVIYSYLSEQLVDFDVKTLKEVLPKTMRRIKRVSKGLTLDQELGLFMHISTNIYRLQHDEASQINIKKNSILSNNKKLYYELTEILKPIESEFMIKFTDNDFSNIIGIIKQVV